jgi:peptidyl-prolyl cis-trans isomerase B (cyclophilin B)
MKSLAVAGLITGSLVLAGCSSGSSGGATVTQDQPTHTRTPTTTANPAITAGCTAPPPLTTSPQANKYSHEPKLTVAPTTYTAKIVTNCGTITVAMNAKLTPHTVNSFNFLAGKGYFTDTPCHRLTTAPSVIYVLQCGDPTGTGYDGPGYQFKDENLAGATYPKGTVAMANSGPDTNGSQFFLVYADSELGANYTPFGRVTSGMNILLDIAKAGSTPPGDGKPNQPVVIKTFTVTKG